MTIFLRVMVLAALWALAGCSGAHRADDAATPLRVEDAATPLRGVVAADHPLASEAGAEVLRAGGNAVDAAVASSFALSVVRPYSCGIGGGGFMVIHLPDDPEHGTVTTALNYRETSPRAVGPDSYERWASAGDPAASRVGGRAVAVPGTVAGLLAAHERYGRLDRDRVMAPAIRLAERGFAIDAHHARTADKIRGRLERDGLADRFRWLDDRLALGEGERWVNREQARVLRLIAARGSDAFYAGPVADAVVAAVRRDGGVLTTDDLAAYRVEEAEPIRVGFRGDDLLLMPPPSSGGVAIGQWFGVLERLGTPIPAEGWYAEAGAHQLIEASKHAFADRARHLADPRFSDVPVRGLLDDGYLDELAARVGVRPLEPGDYGTNATLVGAAEDGGTSHISVVDRWGGAVACTETINTEFGSLLAVPEYGFVLNNEMDDFTTVRGAANVYGLAQSDANLPEPGKRPLSSMSPTIVVDGDGDVRAVAGASGGPRIISATGQVLLRMLVGGADAGAAVRGPRVHHQWSPDVVFVEPGVDEALSLGLGSRGHALRERDEIGVVQAIVRTDGADGPGWSAASDPRKGGAVARE